MALRLMSKVRLFNISTIRYLHVTSVVEKLTQFILSDIGEGIREVNVREWFVKPGDKVSQFDNICLVESDKASVNITSRYDGVIKKLYYKIGETALVGKPLVDIDTLDDLDITTTDVAIAEPYPRGQVMIDQQNEGMQVQVNLSNDFEKKLATPAVRRMALEHNIPLKEVSGTGKSGRVMKEDILNYINFGSKEPQKISSDGETITPISGIKKVMVKTMIESSKIPTFGYCDEINVTKLVELRNSVSELAKKNGITITYMPFFIKALSRCIHLYPEINSSVDTNCENIIIKHYHNIGVAVDTPKGLVVPNIKNVQNLSIPQINRQLNNILINGRDGKLLPRDMSKGTISITNIGAIGGTYAAPLINPPEVCILAIGKVRITPMFAEDKILKSYTCCLSWTADHRIIDGATMARFSNKFKEYIENPYYLLLEF